MQTIHKIKKIIRETPKSVSLILDGKITYQLGQFIMLWLPGVDEKPFAISYLDKDEFRVTIEEKGNFTKAISNLIIGTQIGLRGPYGHGFEPKDNSIIVAGGLGMAPAIELIKKVKNSTIIQGAKSKEFLLYLNDENLTKLIEKNKNKIVHCTDDGSFGIRGFTTQVLKKLINKQTKTVYTCGPEVMIKKVFELCEKKKIECQASLERMMKCAIGVCGSCVCGDQLVCKDGPVFSSEQLRKMKDFGKYARLKSGKKVALSEYFSYRDQ
ncbi:MAG: dihydroorotate dehydrogenase electron transfer subunit [Nanoarchaeota archaeon]|nr:dihydroorotate dehydrogenase electron transfer subunit [Nanoarchaeota archaeon]MBU1005439.1 dihydroorotate dehydrogenase electron transfer subunit [Nanoarchaeota archaeon]MBU1945448.1 dihydroorotate dehydrogenase electron transfer subunit [Nanoarchaeota archaeon]